jgi:hypothetical protein
VVRGEEREIRGRGERMSRENPSGHEYHIEKGKHSDIRLRVAVNGKGHNERQYRNEDLRPRPRDEPPCRLPASNEAPKASTLKYPAIDLRGRDPQERKPSKDDRECSEHREQRPKTVTWSHSTVYSLPAVRKGAFKNIEELKCLKKELNSTPTKAVPKEPVGIRRKSLPKNPQEVAIRELDSQTTKGGLASREKFAEDSNPIHEGVAPRKDAHEGRIPPNHMWTMVGRQLVDPAVLMAFGEWFEVAEGGYVIIWGALSRKEIDFFAGATIVYKGLFCLQY